MKGIKGIQGFVDKIDLDRTRFRGKLHFPNLSSSSKWSGNVITVGTSGEMFNTIQSAIDFIRDASESSPYTLMISGGEYLEAIVLPSWIHLWGSGLVTLNPGDVPAITITGGGETWIFGVQVLPITGTTPAILCTASDLNLFRNYLRRGVVSAGNCSMYFDFIEGGPLVHTLGALVVRTSNSVFYGGIARSGAGTTDIRLVSTLVIGSIVMSDAEYFLQLHNTWVLDPTGNPLLYLDPTDADSYLRMQSSLLSTDSAVPTIMRNALSGTVEVWTMLNALSGVYGPNVNENITTTNNVVDAEIANFRL